MRRVMIDTDPGVDDALALMLAFSSPELRVEAVTTVVGNVSLELANKNALKILEFLGAEETPVAPGASKPLFREPLDATAFHGKTGLSGAELPEPKSVLDPRSAVQVIVELAEEFGEELTLIPIGPLTNIASAILAYPDITNMIGGLVLMGGAFNLTPYGQGNVSAVAEFNIWHDPEAAKIVFESGMPVKAVGLDVTTDPMNRLDRDMYEEIRGLGTRRSRLVSALCGGSIKRFGRFSLHDPMAVALAVDPSLASTESHIVGVETMGVLTRGMTVVDRRRVHRSEGSGPRADICVSVDGPRFKEIFMERVIHGGL